MSEETRLRVIVFREADNWVAHCLEYAISAQARDLDEVKARFEIALHADLAESMRRYGKPFAGIPQSPPYLHELWARGSDFRAELSVDHVRAEMAVAA